MEFNIQVAPSLPQVRCRFCLEPAENARLRRRNLESFYTTFQPCGLGNHLPETGLCGWVCSFCWVRVLQCLRFVTNARVAERLLSSTRDLNTRELPKIHKLHNFATMILEATDHPDRGEEPTPFNTDDCITDSKHAADQISQISPPLFPAVKIKQSNKASKTKSYHKLQSETNVQNEVKEEDLPDEYVNVELKSDAAVQDSYVSEVKQEHSSNDIETDMSIEPTEIVYRPNNSQSSLLLSAVREKVRAMETETLRELQIESLQYTTAQQMEEINMKKTLKKYLNKKFKCSLCGSAYNEEETYEKHIRKFHNESAGAYECGVCRYRFASASLMRAHEAAHARRWRCLACGAVLAARAQCEVHHALCSVGPREHTCGWCGKSYTTEVRLAQHMRRSHRRHEKRFTCDICGKSFRYKHQMRDHIRVHLNIKPFECDTCGKKFTTQYLYRSHKKTHEPKEELEHRYCVECDRYFSNKRTLEKHLSSALVHVSKETYRHACTQCPDRFKLASLLELHVNTVHLLNRTHPCRQCDKAYYSKGALKIHVKNKHSHKERQRDHVCSVCGKAFHTRLNLKNHTVGVHRKERPYACDICGATFGYKAACYTHRRLKHKLRSQRADTATNRARYDVPERTASIE